MKPGVIKIVLNQKACQGCRACEAECSLFHFGVVNPFATGIKINELDELGKFRQVVCAQCLDMPCAAVCPENAIARNSYSGAVEISDACNLCGNCVEACPINAIMLPRVDSIHKAIKCDLCGGLPQCVAICPRQVLSW